MNVVHNPSLMEQLAASYALGTLRGGARRRFEDLARNHATVRAAALVWQGRLASLAELQPHAVPSPAVWKRIENLVQAERQAKAMQAARSAAVPAQSKGWWASLGLWQTAAGASFAAAALVAVISINLRDANEQLSAQLAQLGGQLQGLTAQLAATPQVQYVAVLADDKSAASMLVTFDATHQRLVLKRVGGFQEQADHSLQLWALPQQGGPRSLGVLGSEAVVRLPTSHSAVREVPTLAISLEPRGGVPPGSGPSGPVLFKGSLIEAPL